MLVRFSLVLNPSCRSRMCEWVGLVHLSSICTPIFFSNLHIFLPFDNFTMGVLRTLNIAPTQLHPNTWVSIQAFRLIYDVLCLHPTPFCFLCYYTSHPVYSVLWHSLSIRSEATSYFFNETGWSRFPLYWTKKPRDFKKWPRPTVSIEC